jgi:molecular chaperone DnaK (HSP70)
MGNATARRVLGIDLGTTNTLAAMNVSPADATVPVHNVLVQQGPLREVQVQTIALRQHTDVNEVEALTQLPSVLYHALPEEAFHQGNPSHPWVVGQHAKRRGTETPDRVVVSAKSWLCHAGVDRTAAILPWVSRSDDEPTSVARLSPVAASAAVLKHVVYALEHAGHTPSECDVVVTVPASFDQVARQLTVTAAAQAGLTIRLLEEPQAAFYDWLHRASHQDVAALLSQPHGFVVLVADVGGGTTDLSLLHVKARSHLSEAERLTFEPSELVTVDRIAVGRHLLLGGDNIDLALAHLVERKLGASTRLAPTEFSQLVATCQAAKERLLGPNPPAKVPIRIARRGSSLFGNVLASDLTREEVERLVLDGFLPEHEQSTPLKRGRSGLVGFGLPFESDPAITHHLGQFLAHHGFTSGGKHVDGVLFNGGFFKSQLLADRVSRLLERWLGRPVTVLPNAAPDEAVARGAVYYGLALQGRGVRFTGGSAHGYYVAAGTKDGANKVICVVPKGAPEDEWHRVDQLPLRLTVGKPVRFDLYSNSVDQHTAGQLVALDESRFERVATVGTRLSSSAGKQTDSTAGLPVVLEGCLTPVGTLELACTAADESRRRFELAFEVRGAPSDNTSRITDEGSANTSPASPNGAPKPSSATNPTSAPQPSHAPNASASVQPRSNRAEAEEMFHRVFGKGRKDVHAREVKDLWRDLEQKLGPRQTWDIALTRALADVLLPLASGRRRSVDHERVFFALSGYLLRPGFGYLGDAERIALFEPLFEQGLSFHTERTNWDQFYIAWRRVAAGLNEAAQERIRDVCDPFVAPSELKLKKSKAFKTPEIPALWDLLSWLERAPAERRAHLGQWLLDRTWTSRDPKNWEWLGRVGAREPIYASAHHVVRPRHAEAWLEHLMSEPWEAMPSAPFAAVQLARCTDDRARDVSPSLRERVAAKLEQHAAAPEWVQCVLHHVPTNRKNSSETFGEELPPGLSLDL